MSRPWVVLSSLVIAACGGGSSGAHLPTGTLGGASFSPSEAAAYFLAPVACTIPGVGAEGTSMFLIAFSTSTTACADLADVCSARSNGRFVLLSFAFAGVGSQNDPTIVPGTYPLATSASLGAATTVRPGVFAFAQASSVITDAACTNSGNAFGTGTVTVKRADATGIQGSIEAAFGGGDRLSGDFSVPLCGPFPFDLCATLTSGLVSGTPVCPTGVTCH